MSVRRLASSQEALLLGVLALIFAGFAALSPRLAEPDSIADLLREVSPNLIAALGIAILMLQREFDLSIGAVLALSGVIAVKLFNATGSTWLGVLAALGAGVGLGAVHGLLVVRCGLNSLMTTLATLFLVRGLVYVWTGQVTIVDERDEPFGDLYYGDLLGLPLPAVLALILFAAGAWGLAQTRVGRSVYAIGGNEHAAKVVGIGVERIKLASFVLCSTLASLAGLVIAAQTSSGYFNAGATGFEFIVIAAVVLGGLSLAGGRGTVVGAALGVIIIGVAGKGLRFADVSTNWALVVTGVLMVLAVFAYGVRERRLRGARA